MSRESAIIKLKEKKVQEHYNKQLQKIRDIERMSEKEDLTDEQFEFYVASYQRECAKIQRYIDRIQNDYGYKMSDNEILGGLYL